MSANAPRRTPPHLLSHWAEYTVPIAWLIATYGAILTFPTRLSAVEGGSGALIGMIGVVAGGVLALLNKHSRASSGRQRVVRLVCALVVFFASWMCFQWLQGLWTCPYSADARLTVGPNASADLISFLKQEGGSLTPPWDCRLVSQFTGDTVRMFGYPDLALRYYLLASIYLCCWLSLLVVIWLSIDHRKRSKKVVTQ